MLVSTGQGQCLPDSRCSTHVTRRKEHFSSYVAVAAGKGKICVTNNLEIDALAEGEVTLAVWDEKVRRERNLVIPGVLHVPEYGRNNLLSVFHLCNSGYYVDIHLTRRVALGHDDGLSVTLREVNWLYTLQIWSGQGSVRALAANGGE